MWRAEFYKTAIRNDKLPLILELICSLKLIFLIWELIRNFEKIDEIIIRLGLEIRARFQIYFIVLILSRKHILLYLRN